MKLLILVLCLTPLSFANGLAFQSPTAQTIPADYVIGLEDVLSINVWKEPELSVKDALVRPDGKISVPLVGDIQASGLTPMQLQEQIRGRLKEFLASPAVTVVVLRVASQSVSIVGKVSKPGIYYLGAPMTVLELLARAGGLREDAKNKAISVVREEGTRTVRLPFNYKDVSQGKNLQQNIILKNGDQVIVP
jgi:polysaccharide biosynthesis/export protein